MMKGNIMDQMYYGQSPGNFGQTSHFDAARGECYRDFGDCIGISSRTLLQGLFGIVPQALYGECVLRPCLPLEWDSVTVTTPYLSYTMKRRDGQDIYEITQNFSRPLKIVYRQYRPKTGMLEVEGTTATKQTLVVPTDYSSLHYRLADVVTQEMMERFPQERNSSCTVQLPTSHTHVPHMIFSHPKERRIPQEPLWPSAAVPAEKAPPVFPSPPVHAG